MRVEAKVLRKAAVILREGELARGVRSDGRGGYCALGAIDKAMQEVTFYGEPYPSGGAAIALSQFLRLGEDTREDPWNQRKVMWGGQATAEGEVARWSNLSSGKEEVIAGMIATADAVEAGEVETQVQAGKWIFTPTPDGEYEASEIEPPKVEWSPRVEWIRTEDLAKLIEVEPKVEVEVVERELVGV